MQAKTAKSYEIPLPLLVSTACVALLGLITPNPILTIVGGLIPLILFRLLWRPEEPPVLLFGTGLQWLAVYMPVVSANLNGSTVQEFTGLATMPLAVWLGFATVTMIAMGMRVGIGPGRLNYNRGLIVLVAELKTVRLVLFYLFGLGIALAMPSMATLAGGARQLVLPLSELRWVAVFMILMSVAHGHIRPFFALLFVGLELVVGFSSYFGDFKQVLFLWMLSIVIGRSRRIRLFRPALLSILVFSLLLSIFWQSIKTDYRQFMNRGTGQQVVLVSQTERISFLFTRFMILTPEDVALGAESLLERVGYLEYMARSIEQVPENIPYQKGRLLIEVFKHTFMPRMFFPEKSIISDSVRTNEFAGVRVAGADEGTSIGIGYAGESYIDFGPLLMFVPIFVYGWFWGRSYRFLIQCSPYGLLGASAALVFLMPEVGLFEISNVKLVGGAITNLIVLVILMKFGAGALWRFLTNVSQGNTAKGFGMRDRGAGAINNGVDVDPSSKRVEPR